MNETTFHFDDNLRSISAIIAARNKEENLRKLSIINSKFAPTSINVHQSSLSWNHNLTKDRLQRNKLTSIKAKIRLWKSSKVAPLNQTVFYFDEGSDLTVTDVLSTRYGPTKEDYRNMNKMKAKRRCRCISIFICLFGTFVIGIVSAVVLIVFLLPSHKTR